MCAKFHLWTLAVGLVLLGGSASSAPFVVDYQIRGGTSTGDPLDGQNVASGHLQLTIHNPPSTFNFFSATRDFTVDLLLSGTGGATHGELFPLLFHPGGHLGRLFVNTLYFDLISGNVQRFYTGPGSLIANGTLAFNAISGRLTGQLFTYFRGSNPVSPTVRMGSVTFFGREVGVPEPSISSLLAPGLLFVAAALRLRRWREGGAAHSLK